MTGKWLERTVKYRGHTAPVVALLRGPGCNEKRWPLYEGD